MAQGRLVEHYPSNSESEASVLGGLMTDPSNIHYAMSVLTAEDFFTADYKATYQAICDLVTKSFPVDIVTVGDLLKLRGREIRLSQFVDLFVGNFEAHVDLVKGLAKRRRVQSVLDAARAQVGAEDIDGMISRLAGDLMAISVDKRSEPISLGDAGIQSLKLIEAAMRSPEGAGIKTGFAGYDQHTGGLFTSDQIIIAARPGVGKTILATDICCNAAERGVESLIVNVEMPPSQLATRVLSSRTQIENYKLRRGILTDYQVAQVAQESGLLHDLPIHILAERNWGKIRANIRALKYKRPGLKMVVLDYIQDIDFDGRYNERRLELSEISRQAKQMAKDLDIVSIVLSQINRSQDKKDRPPVMGDLRECGDLEQHADFVTFLHPNSKHTDRIAWMIVKARNAPTGMVELRQLKESVTFRDWDGV